MVKATVLYAVLCGFKSHPPYKNAPVAQLDSSNCLLSNRSLVRIQSGVQYNVLSFFEIKEKHMDITSFILGISSVIVAALVAGVVIGLVKIKGLIRYQRDLGSTFDSNAQNVYNELTAMKDNDSRRWRDHHRTLDSRLDKLISRIESLEKQSVSSNKNKQLLND